MLAFSPHGDRLLMANVGWEKRDGTSRIDLWDDRNQESRSKSLQAKGVIAYSADDGPMILCWKADDPASLLVRDALTGEEKLTIQSPLEGPSSITAIALARDGKRAAGIVWPLRKEKRNDQDVLIPDGDTATIAVWDAATGDLNRKIQAKQHPESDLVLSPDGSSVAAWDLSGRNHEVMVWSVSDGRLIGAFLTDRTVVTSVAFGRDPVWHDDDPRTSPWLLAVGMQGGMITVWDLQTRFVRSLCRGSHYDVKTLDFSPDGALLASAGRDEARLWDVATGTCLLEIPAGSYQFAVAFSPDGHRLAIGMTAAFGFPDGVHILELEQNRGMRTLRGLQGRPEKIAVSGDGRRIAALCNDWTIGVWDKGTGSLIAILEAPVGVFTDNAGLALNGDGSRLVCSAGSQAKLWDAEAGRLIGKWTLPPALTEAPAFRPGGQLLLLRQETKGRQLPPVLPQANPQDHPRVCRLYELPDEGPANQVAEISDFDWYVFKIATTPDASHFAIEGISTGTGQAVRSVCIYDGPTGKQVESPPTARSPGDPWKLLEFDPKGTRLAVSLDPSSESLSLYDVPSLKLVGTIPDLGLDCLNTGGTRWIDQLAPTADSPESLLLKAQGSPTPSLLLRIVLDVHRTTGQFSPDGNQVIWGSQDGSITVCDLKKVRERLTGIGLGW
jgi:WD40 repeat protein